jgi:hypothetical protein
MIRQPWSQALELRESWGSDEDIQAWELPEEESIREGRLIKFLLIAYGISLGAPDIAVSVAGAVRFRIDDAIAGLLCLGMAFGGHWRTLGRPRQKAISAWAVFALYCLVSAVFFWLSSPLGVLPYFWYTVARMLGGLILLVGIVGAATKKDLFHCLCVGVCVGGILLAGQVLLRFRAILSRGLPPVYWGVRTVITFETWNPNSIGLISIVFAFSATMCSLLTSSRTRRGFWLTAASLFSLIPIITFARASAIAMVVGWMVFLLVSGRAKTRIILPLTVAAILAVAWLLHYSGRLGAQAWDIDIISGRGFSGRYQRWQTALGMFRERPLLGSGFGSEMQAYERALGAATVSHSSYVSVLIELGLVGFALYGVAIVLGLRAIARLVPFSPKERSLKAAALGLMAALLIDAVGYCQKSNMVGIAVAIASISVISRGLSLSPEQVDEAVVQSE